MSIEHRRSNFEAMTLVEIADWLRADDDQRMDAESASERLASLAERSRRRSVAFAARIERPLRQLEMELGIRPEEGVAERLLEAGAI